MAAIMRDGKTQKTLMRTVNQIHAARTSTRDPNFNAERLEQRRMFAAPALAIKEFPGGTASSTTVIAYGPNYYDLAYYDSLDHQIKWAVADATGSWSAPESLGHGGPSVSVTTAFDDADDPYADFAFSGAHGRGLYVRDYGPPQLAAAAGHSVSQVSIQWSFLSRIVYFDQTTHKLQFLEGGYNDNGAYPRLATIASGDIEDAQFVIGPQGQNVVAFIDKTDGTIDRATELSNGHWHISFVAYAKDGADGLSLAQDGSGDIAYQDLATGNLMLAVPGMSGGFTSYTIAHGMGEDTSFPDSSDLYAYDAQNDTVQYFSNLLDHDQETTIIPGGGPGLQVQDGSDFGQIEIAYVDSASGDLFVDLLQQAV